MVHLNRSQLGLCFPNVNYHLLDRINGGRCEIMYTSWNEVGFCHDDRASMYSDLCGHR